MCTSIIEIARAESMANAGTQCGTVGACSETRAARDRREANACRSSPPGNCQGATSANVSHALVQISRVMHKIIDIDSKRFILCISYVRNLRLKWRTLATHECRRMASL